MHVTVRLGRRFAAQAGFAERAFDLPDGASADALLAAIASAAPGLEPVEAGAVDLALASLSVNGQAVDPRHPAGHPLRDGDACYLYGPVSGG